MKRIDLFNSQLEHTRQILEAAFMTARSNALRDWTEMESAAWDAYQRARAQMLQQPPAGERIDQLPGLDTCQLVTVALALARRPNLLLTSAASLEQQARNELTFTIRARKLQPNQKIVLLSEELLWQFGIFARSVYDRQNDEIKIEQYGPAGFLGARLEQKDLLGMLNISLEQIANLAPGAKLTGKATFSKEFVIALRNWRVKDGKNALKQDRDKVATVTVEFDLIEILKRNVQISFDIQRLADGFTIEYGNEVRRVYSGTIELRLGPLPGLIGFSVWIGGQKVLDYPGNENKLIMPGAFKGELPMPGRPAENHYLSYLVDTNIPQRPV